MTEHVTPLVVYLPVGLDAAEQGGWCEAVLGELVGAGAVDRDDAGAWRPLLTAAAADVLPEGVSGAALLVSAEQPPTYLWITMAQPAGWPTGLGDAVLDTQLPGAPLPAPALAAPGQVYQRIRRGWVERPDGAPVFTQTSVTATTLAVPVLGDTDVCLWFTSLDPVAADALQPAIAELAVSAELLTYLSS